jgi:hypothetical protein
MKRFLAVVGLVAFFAACSDSNMTSPVSRAARGSALHDPGNPPPPPLGGSDGSGDLVVGSSGLAPNTQPTVACNHSFFFGFSWSYLQANGSTNQVVHADLTGTSLSGSLDLHDIQNGKFVTHGSISDGSFSFTIQDTNSLDVTSTGFDAQVTGTLTNLSTGAQCQATAQLTGTFSPG